MFELLSNFHGPFYGIIDMLPVVGGLLLLHRLQYGSWTRKPDAQPR